MPNSCRRYQGEKRRASGSLTKVSIGVSADEPATTLNRHFGLVTARTLAVGKLPYTVE
jgi:hypothetical protein